MSAFKKMFKQEPVEDKNRPMTDQEKREWELCHAQNMKAEEARETKKARDWLHEKGICNRNLEGPERRKKIQAYVATLSKPKPGKDWATSIIEQYEAGDYPHEYGYRLACDAMHHEPIKVDRGTPF